MSKHLSGSVRMKVLLEYKLLLNTLPRWSVAEIAERNGVSPAYVSRLARRERISRYAPRGGNNGIGTRDHST